MAKPFTVPLTMEVIPPAADLPRACWAFLDTQRFPYDKMGIDGPLDRWRPAIAHQILSLGGDHRMRWEVLVELESGWLVPVPYFCVKFGSRPTDPKPRDENNPDQP